jgi:hypothetical protein
MGSYAFGQTSADSLKAREIELSKMGKLSLTRIYTEIVASSITTLPNLPFVSSSEDVPSNWSTKYRWKKINKSSYRHIKVLRKYYKDLMPYADKKDLVRAILFMEDLQRREMESKN